MSQAKPTIASRFRGFLPVIVDVETAGFNAVTDALLEIAMVTINMDESGKLYADKRVACNVEPFDGANLDPKSLAFNGIDPENPLRGAFTEREALQHCFQPVRHAVKESGCNRAILVGHNAPFDLGFINAAVERCSYKRNPFHPFSTLDTVSLAALAVGHTVLARSAQLSGMEWSNSDAHSAIYDADQTAELFCRIINRWDETIEEKPWLPQALEEVG